MERIQEFSIDSGVPFDQVLKLPFYMLDDYYRCGSWNIKKPHALEHAQITESFMQMLKNILVVLKSLKR